MKRVLFAGLFASALGCGLFGNGGNELVLEANQGGIFVIVEMPNEGVTDTSIVGLDVEVLTLGGQLLLKLPFNSNDLNLSTGRWPSTIGSCNPFKANLEDAAQNVNFLPANSSCITFTLIHDFDPQNQTDQELLTTLRIEAVDGAGTAKAQIARTVEFKRGVFQGDPAAATVTADLAPFVATLQVR